MNITTVNDVSYWHITTATELEELLQLMKNTHTAELAVDTETAAAPHIKNSSALDRHTATVQLVQLMSMEWQCPCLIDVTVLGIKQCIPVIEMIRDKFVAVAFNAKFDIQQIRSTFGVQLINVHCAQVNLKLIGGATGFKASKLRGNSYKAFCRDLFQVFLDKDSATSNWATVTKTDSQLVYAALDVGAHNSSDTNSYLLEGYLLLKDLIINQYNMEEIFYLEQENVVAMADAEYVGMPINTHLLDSLLTTTAEEIEQIKVDIATTLKLEVRQRLEKSGGAFKKVKYITPEVNKMLNSASALPTLVNKYLKGTGVQLDSAQGLAIEAAASLLDETHSEQKHLLEQIVLYKNLTKVIDKKWDELINPISGCIHPNFNTIGASTGRMSSSSDGGDNKFNAQSLAKRKVVVEVTEEQFMCCDSKVMQ